MIVLRIEHVTLGLKPHTFLPLHYQMHLSFCKINTLACQFGWRIEYQVLPVMVGPWLHR